MRKSLLAITVLGVAAATCVTMVESPEGAQAAFPGQNGKIVYTDVVGMGIGSIVTIEPDGSAATTIRPGDQNFSASWSPDGTRLAFAVHDGMEAVIWVMDADGSNPTQVTDGTAWDRNPAWSPDGTKIVFSSNRDGAGMDLWVVGVDGTGLAQLTNRPSGESDIEPDWSSDGSKIVFASDRGSTGLDVWIMDADGSNQVPLTSGPRGERFPSFSPDASKITYSQTNDGVDGQESDIWVMNADGSAKTNLTMTPDATEEYPTFSPDGSMIAYTARSQGQGADTDIWTMAVDGTGQTQITSDPVDEQYLDWQPIVAPPATTTTTQVPVTATTQVPATTTPTTQAPVTTTNGPTPVHADPAEPVVSVPAYTG